MTVDGQKIHANKLFLSRSLVFESLEADPLGANGDTIPIGDVKHEVLKEMVHFLYTDEVPEIKKFAVELLAAANTYQLGGLVDQCVTFLQSNPIEQSKITMDNFLPSLVLSERFDIDNLKDTIIEYVYDNRDAVLSSPGWRTLKEISQKLAIEVLARCFQKLPEDVKNFKDSRIPAHKLTSKRK